MKRSRKNYTPQEKVPILRGHLLDRVPVSDLSEELHLRPSMFYRWQKEFFEKELWPSNPPEPPLSPTVLGVREEKQGGRCKPDSVVGDHLSGTAVASGLKLPTREFAARRRCGASHASLSYLALLRTGFAVPARSPGTAVGSYPTISPLPAVAGGIFSVALSVGLPLLDVIQRSALWSPDFPRAG